MPRTRHNIHTAATIQIEGPGLCQIRNSVRIVQIVGRRYRKYAGYAVQRNIGLSTFDMSLKPGHTKAVAAPWIAYNRVACYPS